MVLKTGFGELGRVCGTTCLLCADDLLDSVIDDILVGGVSAHAEVDHSVNEGAAGQHSPISPDGSNCV